MAIETKSNYRVEISKQGIDQRFNEGALKLIHTLINEVLSNQITESVDVGWLQAFNRVIIKDSTKFDLNARVKNKLPGFGGSASEAGACIQYEFDIKTGYVNDLAITPANASDSKNALSTLDSIRKDDLTIRDLGYFKTSFFKEIQKKGAYFLSRLNASVAVYQEREGKLREVDFGCLYKEMVNANMKTIELDVFIHTEHLLPVRLIAEPVLEEVYNQRMKKLAEYNRKKGHQLTQNYRNRARFNLFMTNISPEKMSGKAIAKVYKVRWQIELVFKVWKSIFSIDNVVPMRYERLMTTLYAKLLIILLNWETIMIHRLYLYKKKGRLLSINKCFKTLKDSHHLKNILTNGSKDIEKWILWTQEIFETKHWLEKKKNKLGFMEIISLNVL